MVFDFDEWAALYEMDPSAFEMRRRAVIQQFLESLPEDRRRRLEIIQQWVESERERSPNPLSACIRLNAMMWDSFIQLQKALFQLHNMSQVSGTYPQNKNARIIQFPREPNKGK